MSDSLEKLKALRSKLEKKLQAQSSTATTDTPSLSDTIAEQRAVATPTVPVETKRRQNLERLRTLHKKLGIDKKVPEVSQLFTYKAMNLSGIGLKENDFGEVREGKYIQIISIIYEPDKYGKKRAKNVSMGYFGKAETLEDGLKHDIIEFVLRWRYEKAFQNVEHYEDLLSRLERL